jgi:hypothetical protein
MNLKTWQQLNEIKSNILSSIDYLIKDDFTEREVIAWDLLRNVKELRVLEFDFSKATTKGLLELYELAKAPISEAETFGRADINFSLWQLITTLKSLLLSATIDLLENNSVTRYEIASRLVGHVYCIDQIETGCIEQLQKSEFSRIDSLYENIENERDHCYSV